VACLASGALLCSAAELTPQDELLIRCAKGDDACADVLRAEPPPLFSTLFTTRSGGRFVIHAVSEWSPPHAQRFYALVRLQYFEGAPLYRVLRNDSDPSHGTDFVAQWGYRGVPEVDQAWIGHQTSPAVAPVLAPGGNRRGSVAFGTGIIARNASTPYCTVAECSFGFSVELFVNTGTGHAARLDSAGFSPFGYIIDCSELGVLDAAFAGYGELQEICQQPSDGGTKSTAGSRYCVPLDVGGYAGVSLNDLLRAGAEATEAKHPMLDAIASVQLLDSRARDAWPADVCGRPGSKVI
jgi:hypothetical protein